jgi:hypothetical protein
MFKKRFFIVLVVTLCSLSCSYLTKRGGEGEVLLDATDVGVPNGPSATEDIGPAGGSIASPDGRLTLMVPANAVSAPVAFAIQPITNQAFGGLGNAYRLEPSGTTFATPLEISIHFDDHDLEGTIPEALALAYQDEKGSWRAFESGKLNQDTKTLTVLTTHFTDWSFLARTHLSPAKTDLFVNEGVYLELSECGPPRTFLLFFTESGTCRKADIGPWVWNVNGIPGGNSTVGTLTRTNSGVLYTAPAKKPMPSTVTVSLPYQIKIGDETHKGTWKATVTIHEPGYIASGFDGPVVYSSVVCDLEVPFTITGTHPLGKMNFNFTPSSPTAGKMVFDGFFQRKIKYQGSGTYTIEGADADTPVIVVQTKSTATLMAVPTRGDITNPGGGEARITLARLTTRDPRCMP